ncbi:preprotein translocase subunit SecG [Gloeomargaritaceae cyanobacterium AH-226-B11]|jgi:protein translocase SecG subunit|nr:preprotein translocase subunit SecG [Gloeomargaritaceae cyanobacterium AH-226-B11]
MLKIFWLLICVSLILLIVIRVPSNSGLDNFASKTDLLGSPGSAEKFLNNLTWLLIGLYALLAIKFNLSF